MTEMWTRYHLHLPSSAIVHLLFVTEMWTRKASELAQMKEDEDDSTRNSWTETSGLRPTVCSTPMEKPQVN